MVNPEVSISAHYYQQTSSTGHHVTTFDSTPVYPPVLLLLAIMRLISQQILRLFSRRMQFYVKLPTVPGCCISFESNYLTDLNIFPNLLSGFFPVGCNFC